MKPVLVMEMPVQTTPEMARQARDQALSRLGEDYHVLVVTQGIHVYEVGRWLWQRALRRSTP